LSFSSSSFSSLSSSALCLSYSSINLS
jgi:hypothetical protein